MSRTRFMRFATAWMPVVAVGFLTAPVWLFVVRLWWSATHALLTKPWDQIFCIGYRCLP